MGFSERHEQEAHWTRTQETDSILSVELEKVEFFVYSAWLCVPTFQKI